MLIKLDQLTPENLAVIEYLYSLSTPPADPPPLAERARRGLSHFLMYVAEIVAHEPGMLSFLPDRTLKDAIWYYHGNDAHIFHVLEVLIQKVMTDATHTPDTYRNTTPLAWSRQGEGKTPGHIPRFAIYVLVMKFLYRGIEGLDDMWITRGLVQIKLELAIEKHYGSPPSPRGRKA